MKEIITRFAVASAEHVAAIRALSSYQEKQLLQEMNGLSNTWLIVYADHIPAGFARISTKGVRPSFTAGKKAACIADFRISEAYADTAASAALLEKCLQAGKQYDIIWLERPAAALLPLFTGKGFREEQGYLVRG